MVLLYSHIVCEPVKRGAGAAGAFEQPSQWLWYTSQMGTELGVGISAPQDVLNECRMGTTANSI